MLNTDTLFEGLTKFLIKSPLSLFLLPFWLFKGLAHFKKRLFSQVKLNPQLLPYNQTVLDFIKKEKNNGRKLILATATDISIASYVADHLGLFDEVIATDDKQNLRGVAKRDILVSKFGEKGYDYIADSRRDIPVWNSANTAYLVNVSKNVNSKIQSNKHVIAMLDANRFIEFIKEIRVYQWIKNLLLFLPLFMAHRFTDINSIIVVVIAFICFSFIASAIYLVNDLVDLESDRKHPRKSKRPFASGDLPIWSGYFITPLLFIFGLGGSFFLLPTKFTLVLIIYFGFTLLYSFILKKLAVFDIIVLAGLYTIRIIAGAYAVDLYISPWLLAFSMFFFLSLSVIKRYTEVISIKAQNFEQISGRGYIVADIDFLRGIGMTSGYLSVLVLALYMNSKEVISLYRSPEILWSVAPLLLLWITRAWHIAHRGKMHDDPIIFAFKDTLSYIILALLVIIILIATVI